MSRHRSRQQIETSLTPTLESAERRGVLSRHRSRRKIATSLAPTSVRLKRCRTMNGLAGKTAQSYPNPGAPLGGRGMPLPPPDRNGDPPFNVAGGPGQAGDGMQLPPPGVPWQPPPPPGSPPRGLPKDLGQLKHSGASFSPQPRTLATPRGLSCALAGPSSHFSHSLRSTSTSWSRTRCSWSRAHWPRLWQGRPVREFIDYKTGMITDKDPRRVCVS